SKAGWRRRPVGGDRSGDAPSDPPTRCPFHAPARSGTREDCMRARTHFDRAGLRAGPRRGHAGVGGGSLAGMPGARCPSDPFARVALLDGARFPEERAAGKGLPQGRHAHALLERGRGALERLLPGLTGELVRAGAAPLDFTRDVAWMTASGWYVRF